MQLEQLIASWLSECITLIKIEVILAVGELLHNYIE